MPDGQTLVFIELLTELLRVYLSTVLTRKHAPLRVDLPLVPPQGVLVPEHLAADVALHGLLLVRAVYVGLGAQLRAVRADQLDVGLSHVLLQVSLRVKHLSALLTRPVTRRSSRMVITQMLLQVPKSLKEVISLCKKYR